MPSTGKTAIAASLTLALLPLASQRAGALPAPCYTVPDGVQTLNGTSDYSTNAYGPSMDRPNVTGQISVAAWICPNQADTPQVVLKREGAYELLVAGTGERRITFKVWTNTGVHHLVSDACLDTLRWQHIAGTYDGMNWRIYHNGRPVGSVARSNGFPAAGSLPPSAQFSPDAGTVLLWHLDESTGTNTADAAAPVLDGANTGVIMPDTALLDYGWTTGRFGGGLNSLSNGTGHASAPLGAGLFSKQATMEAWIRPTAIAPDGSYVMGWAGPGPEYSFIRLDQGGSVAGVGFRVTDGSGAYWAQADFSLPVNLLDGAWRHVAGTYENGVIKCYLNGALMGSHDTGYGTGWTLMSPNALIAAGCAPWDPAGSSSRFIGDIDEVRLSNVARTGFPLDSAFSPDADTVLLWHFNEGSGTSTADAAAPVLDGANTGTIAPNYTRGWVTGQFGGGLISGSNSSGYAAASLGAGLFSKQATMDAWIRPTAIAPGGSYVMGWSGPGAGQSFIRLYQGGSVAGVGFRVTDGSGAYWAQADFSLPVNLLDGAWRHIAGTFSNGIVRLFLNGMQAGAADTGYGTGWTLMPPNTFIAAGGAPWDPTGSSGGRYLGDIDEVRLSNVARNDFGAAPSPLWLGANFVSGVPQMFFGGNLADLKVYDVALAPEDVSVLAATPPATLPAPAGSVTATQTINGAVIALEIGNGLRLNQLGGTISSGGGRLFVVNVNGVPVSSDRVTVRQAEITALDGGWQIPFGLPGGQGTGVLEFLPGGAPGFVQAKLSLTNNGPASEWQVAFPHLEGMSLDGLAPADVEFFFP